MWIYPDYTLGKRHYKLEFPRKKDEDGWRNMREKKLMCALYVRLQTTTIKSPHFLCTPHRHTGCHIISFINSQVLRNLMIELVFYLSASPEARQPQNPIKTLFVDQVSCHLFIARLSSPASFYTACVSWPEVQPTVTSLQRPGEKLWQAGDGVIPREETRLPGFKARWRRRDNGRACVDQPRAGRFALW